MATHSSTLAWKIPQTEEPGGLQSTGRKESDTAEHAHRTAYVLLLRTAVCLGFCLLAA